MKSPRLPVPATEGVRPSIATVAAPAEAAPLTSGVPPQLPRGEMPEGRLAVHVSYWPRCEFRKAKRSR
jgi:hypothetical protein